MALPNFQAAGTKAEGTEATPGWPTHQAGDIGLLLAETRFLSDLSDPSGDGWATVENSPQSFEGGGTVSTTLRMFWKRATSSSEAGPALTSANHLVAQILTFRACIVAGNPYETGAGGGDALDTASTSVVIPGGETTIDDCLIVAAVAMGQDTDTAQFSAWANSDLANVLERADSFTAIGNGGGFGVATGELATAGTFGVTTATSATSFAQARISLALMPEEETGTTVTPAMLTHARTLHALDLDTTLLPAILTHTRALHAPAASPSVAPAALTHTRVLHAPTVEDAGVLLLPDLLEHSRTLHDPAASPSALPGALTHTRALHGPAVGATLKPAALTHARQVFAPNVVHVATPETLEHTRTLHAPGLNVAFSVSMLIHGRQLHTPVFPGITPVGASHTHSIHPHRHRDGDEF